jgi:hypothetical protein
LTSKDAQTPEVSIDNPCLDLEDKSKSTRSFFEVFWMKNQLKPVSFELEIKSDLVFETIESSLGSESLFY